MSLREQAINDLHSHIEAIEASEKVEQLDSIYNNFAMDEEDLYLPSELEPLPWE